MWVYVLVYGGMYAASCGGVCMCMWGYMCQCMWVYMFVLNVGIYVSVKCGYMC